MGSLNRFSKSGSRGGIPLWNFDKQKIGHIAYILYKKISIRGRFFQNLTSGGYY
jgi:hypothetical protein